MYTVTHVMYTVIRLRIPSLQSRRKAGEESFFADRTICLLRDPIIVLYAGLKSNLILVAIPLVLILQKLLQISSFKHL